MYLPTTKLILNLPTGVSLSGFNLFQFKKGSSQIPLTLFPLKKIGHRQVAVRDLSPPTPNIVMEKKGKKGWKRKKIKLL